MIEEEYEVVVDGVCTVGELLNDFWQIIGQRLHLKPYLRGKPVLPHCFLTPGAIVQLLPF